MRSRQDAELYLRMAVERALLDHEQGGRHGSSVWSAAGALLAVEAIDDELADQILADYDLASFLRNKGGGAFMHRRAAAAQAKTSSGRTEAARQPRRPPRALNCNLDLEAPWGRVKVPYVVLSETFTQIAVQTSDPSGHVRGGFGALAQVQLSDDRGTASTAQFHGTGTQGGYTGVLMTDKPLHRDTQWIAAGPMRIDLPEGDGVTVAVKIEDLPAMDPALRHLWATVVDRRPMPVNGDLEAAIAALAAVGAVDPESDQLGEIRGVAEAVRGPWVPRPHPRPQAPHIGKGLPEPWSSLVATRRRTAPGGEGTTAVGAVTPPIDGKIVVIVAGLQCYTDSFGIQVNTYPGLHIGFGVPRDDGPLAWWAEDDGGGIYLGSPNSWGGNPDTAGGTITFTPGIDTKCRRIRILPTGTKQRAVIDVPLPWSNA